MPSTAEHYETLLAPIYTWMVGGADAAFALGHADLAAVIDRGGCAVDLGAGFGMHTIPLARAGWQVLAIDSSATLLHELSRLADGLAVRTHRGDLVSFAAQLPTGERPDLVLCMGDTLTHLESSEDVAALARAVAECLSPSGRFIATFRDYTRLPSGNARFIPVRSDEHRILTCFLEEIDDQRVLVHDILHERVDDAWATRISSYQKLRLSPDVARGIFGSAGLHTTIASGARGMVQINAVL